MNSQPKIQPDWWILIASLLLLAIGIIMVFSSSQYVAVNDYDDAFHYMRTQSLAAAIGLVFMFLAYHIDLNLVKRLTGFISFLVLGVLVFMVVSSNIASIGGAQRWMQVGAFSFQPSELCKVAVPMFLAKLLADRQNKITSFSISFVPALIAIMVPVGLIFLQQDLSTAVVVAAAGFIMMFCAGIRAIYLFGLVGLGLGTGIVAIIIEPYRMERIYSWLDPWSDPSDAGLQMVQSLLAFGNGGLAGVGLGAGGSKWYYLPARHTDFILSVMGEEIGFIGVSLVVLLFCLLLWRGLMVAVHCQNVYGALLALGLTSSIGVQTLMNMGVVTGLLPVTGVTLPFISYGGSSLILSLIAVGLLLNISRCNK